MSNLTYKISIPTDNGFWGRECKLCSKYFKIDSNQIKEEMFCPYCGELQRNDDLWTKQQEKEVNRIAGQIGKQILEKELDKMLKGIVSGSKHMSYNPGSRTQITKPLSHLEKEVDTQLECPKCKMKFQVYGIFGFCPGCRADNVLIYEANLDLILQEIDNSSNVNRSLRHAYNDFVATFESYCKRTSEKHKLGSVNFQNLKNTRKLFKKNGIDIYKGLSDLEKTSIKRVFEKRHAYQHSNGIITQEFIKNVPQDSKLLDTIATLSRDEFSNAVNVLKKMLKNITDKYGS